MDSTIPTPPPPPSPRPHVIIKNTCVIESRRFLDYDDYDDDDYHPPSHYSKAPWRYAFNHNNNKQRTSNSGKWLIFVSRNEVDKAWEIIERETMLGNLGTSSKVSTRSDKYPQHVICVYTYDYMDKGDVMRVREHLRKLGFIRKMPYKTDNDTRNGIYSHNGHKNINKYYL
jgi:hypothetical protein